MVMSRRTTRKAATPGGRTTSKVKSSGSSLTTRIRKTLAESDRVEDRSIPVLKKAGYLKNR
jgi:hypothetical protein